MTLSNHFSGDTMNGARRCPLWRAAVIVGLMTRAGADANAEDVESFDELTWCEQSECAWGYDSGCYVDYLSCLDNIGQ